MGSRELQTQEIISLLEPGIKKYFGDRRYITQLRRQEYSYRSSYQLEELFVELDDGSRVEVLFKDLSPSNLPAEIRRMRPEFHYSPEREIHAYTGMLTNLPLRTAKCYAFKLDQRQGDYWLFLEKVNGKELYQFGEPEVWHEAARWLATFHSMSERFTLGFCDLQPLVWDRRNYSATLELAQRQRSEELIGSAEQANFDRVAASYSRAVDRLLVGPTTLIHGEFFASNVLVTEDGSVHEICPIDWETVGLGPPLLDLAALVAGSWNSSDRDAMMQAYWHGLVKSQRDAWPSWEAFQTDLTACRLHLALQMLGRPPDWKPPAEHAQDWFSEALRLADELHLRLSHN